jgi:hypothetical protein
LNITGKLTLEKWLSDFYKPKNNVFEACRGTEQEYQCWGLLELLLHADMVQQAIRTAIL